MTRLVIKSWLLIFYIDLVMQFLSFKTLHTIVRSARVRESAPVGGSTTAELCHAVDLACVFYFKQVKCLQRSSATALLLRQHGWNATMVIGAQIRSGRYHAWVEIDRSVANDAPNMLDIYQVLERC